ncbi:nephrin [Nephila pilipes]|uniref:Nephrin n=1 Tax=Nephila pilipes TaxID=299642 RepID=A0A8X6UVB1_NEPPI|nr:nephrin [Nephila pilipes]
MKVILGQQYFRVKPHDTSVIAGRTAELHCHVGNRAGLVQWSKDGFIMGYEPDLPGYDRYEMRVDHTKSAYNLLVHDARLDDEAEYQCQVGPGKNDKPIRSVARLTVLVPPKYLSINDLPNGGEIEVREAEKVVLQCQALSSKPATILKWYRKNIELMPEASRTTVRREGEKLYSTLSSITLYPKGDTSGSTYTCEALHPALEKPLKTTVCVGVLYRIKEKQRRVIKLLWSEGVKRMEIHQRILSQYGKSSVPSLQLRSLSLRSDFRLFRQLKEALRDSRFDSVRDVWDTMQK